MHPDISPRLPSGLAVLTARTGRSINQPGIPQVTNLPLLKDDRLFDYEIVTDGSGHADGFGGWAATVRKSGDPTPECITGNASGIGSVYRMEFTALLEALTLVLQRRLKSTGSPVTPAAPLRVQWCNDNEALVRSVRRSSANGEPLYARNHAADLWCRFEHLEPLVNVHAVHMSREDPIMAAVDYLASAQRDAVRMFCDMHTLPDVNYAISEGLAFAKARRDKAEKSSK